MSRDTFDRATIEPVGGENYRVYLWGVYPPSSVLAGQERRVYLIEGTLSACRAALAKRPDRLKVEQLEGRSMRPHISLAHLPGEDDPVPGGMYPDDIGDWPPGE
jgi:hypothetical protein